MSSLDSISSDINHVIEIIQSNEEKHGFFLVMGRVINKDGSNILEFVHSDIIPRKGDFILTNKISCMEVNKVIYNYQEVQYSEPKDRGKELIYVFV